MERLPYSCSMITAFIMDKDKKSKNIVNLDLPVWVNK